MDLGGSLGVDQGSSGVIRASEYISIDTAGPKTQFINPDTRWRGNSHIGLLL